VSQLLKEFKEKDVQRIRNLITKKAGNASGIQVGYSKSTEIHKEGDIWEENGRTWTIKNGLRQNVTKLDAAKKAFQIPLRCPKCGGPMKHWLAHKMYKIHGFCFDPCTVEYEAELRRAGLYEAYEKNMMQGSMKAFARDVEQYILESLESVDTFVTEQGDVEDWNNNNAKFKEQVNEKLQKYLKYLRSHIDS
jgi:hypothetical protein